MNDVCLLKMLEALVHCKFYESIVCHQFMHYFSNGKAGIRFSANVLLLGTNYVRQNM